MTGNAYMQVFDARRFRCSCSALDT